MTGPGTDSAQDFERRCPPVSVAPMMDVTDQHTRWLYRAISKYTLLYTEMVTAHALHKGDADWLLAYTDVEHPIALQLGGDDPQLLAWAAKLGESHGYDEVNINVGCPSPRVKKGNFGACLMLTPEVVAECVAQMKAAVAIPVTVKCRIGVDDQDGPATVHRFTELVTQAGADRVTVHARKAWLNGLSPKENRNIPPLNYGIVHDLARAFPNVVTEINGGIQTLDEVANHLEHVDAVMIGRGVWHRPWMLADADRRFFGSTEAPPTRREVVERWVPFVERQIARGHKPQHVVRHASPLFAGCHGSKLWKRALAEVRLHGVQAIWKGLEAAEAAQQKWSAA